MSPYRLSVSQLNDFLKMAASDSVVYCPYCYRDNLEVDYQHCPECDRLNPMREGGFI